MNKCRFVIVALSMIAFGVLSLPARAEGIAAELVLRNWYRMTLELVRHTPTYTPPVASRAFAYLGIVAYEALAGKAPGIASLAGQLNGLTPLPSRAAQTNYDEAILLQAAMATAVGDLFANTGPTGQRAMAAMREKLRGAAIAGVDAETIARSEALGEAIAAHVLAWSRTDGGAVILNQGFPLDYTVSDQPGRWQPTNAFVQQQKPLLPTWGSNRTFAMPNGATCLLPPPPVYSEDPSSPFMLQTREVHDVVKALTPEQRAIARFWADDAMLSVTPPGHWASIALQIINRDNLDARRSAELMARLGIAMADAFIGCWHEKYRYDFVRPITVIRRLIDPAFEPPVLTPPFPEYPSGHSTLSGAAAAVLEAFFGSDFPFEDRTSEADGLGVRSFAGFRQAADEAGISRLYGGIHFRAAIENGLAQGRCIATHAIALRMGQR